MITDSRFIIYSQNPYSPQDACGLTGDEQYDVDFGKDPIASGNGFYYSDSEPTPEPEPETPESPEKTEDPELPSSSEAPGEEPIKEVVYESPEESESPSESETLTESENPETPQLPKSPRKTQLKLRLRSPLLHLSLTNLPNGQSPKLL